MKSSNMVKWGELMCLRRPQRNDLELFSAIVVISFDFQIQTNACLRKWKVFQSLAFIKHV